MDTIVRNLTKTEYLILTRFYLIDECMTKKEFIEKTPELNANTTIMSISHLHKKGFLKVVKICQTNTTLSRAYRPRLSLKTFFDTMFGPDTLEHLAESFIRETQDPEILETFLTKVRIAKSNLNGNQQSIVHSENGYDEVLIDKR